MKNMMAKGLGQGSGVASHEEAIALILLFFCKLENWQETNHWLTR